jgi:predicted HTH domain antitoxin
MGSKERIPIVPMPEISPDNGPNSPRGPDGGPFEPLQNEVRSIRTTLGLFFDDPEEVFRTIYEDVLALPPEERFTDSIEVVGEVIREEVGSLEAAAALSGLDESDSQRMNRRLITLTEELLERSLQPVWGVRDAKPAVATAAGLSAIRFGFQYLEEQPEVPDEDRKQIVSTLLALMARILNIADLDQDEFDVDDVLRDLGYTVHYIGDAAEGGPEFPDPDETEFEEVRDELFKLGSVIAYQNLNISVGRGAELAGLSRFEFEELLEAHDIEPRYGPESVDGLQDGVGMIDE